MTIGERLRATRKKQNITLSELARKSGIAASTIGTYEGDFAEPGLFKIMCICEVLNVSIDYIAKGE